MANRWSTDWSDAELVLLNVLCERGPISDAWPNGRLFRSCRVCGVEFVPTRSGDSGPWPRQCSRSCRRIYGAWNTQQWRLGLLKLRSECDWCFGPILRNGVSARNRSKYCSRDCYLDANKHLSSNPLLDRCDVSLCRDCGRITNLTKVRRTNRRYTRRPSGRCDDCRRRAERLQELQRIIGPVRRQRLRNVVIAAGDRISAAEVVQRYGSVCYLCHEQIDVMIDDSNDPMYLNIDHIIPISRGGQHTWDNVAATHRRCNLSKGSKLMAPPVGWKGTWLR